MRNIKRLVLAVIVLLVVASTLLFVLENQQSVSLVFLGFSGPQLPVSVLVLVALLVGLAVGPMLGWFVARRVRGRARKVA